MGPGYVVAAVFETSGLIGLVVGGLVLRAERQARVADLRDFLRSGQSALSASGLASPSRWRGGASRVVNVPVGAHRRGAGQSRESVARSALGRAIGQSNIRTAPRRMAPINAG
ncbi:hypothetical protein [Methylobacterium pseudosasicola]|uniref:Uncharacterized protein n=1 Tax=Methylobacterium pseudosasicola TaxID=582667 RepID=A0A1I4SZ78_9HYPH|nr:hypothetical protein [Methylobacterium pseudosasicola]SFM69697.1 hypothetical protein SAMN05192568_104716 [Methylobacterium pseudosasicola]